jgi:hypothetical protein
MFRKNFPCRCCGPKRGRHRWPENERGRRLPVPTTSAWKRGRAKRQWEAGCESGISFWSRILCPKRERYTPKPSAYPTASRSLAEEAPDRAVRLEGAAVPGHIVVTFRDPRLRLRARFAGSRRSRRPGAQRGVGRLAYASRDCSAERPYRGSDAASHETQLGRELQIVDRQDPALGQRHSLRFSGLRAPRSGRRRMVKVDRTTQAALRHLVDDCCAEPGPLWRPHGRPLTLGPAHG